MADEQPISPEAIKTWFSELKATLLEKRMLTQVDVARHLSAAEQRLTAVLNGQALPPPAPATPGVQRTALGPPGQKAVAPRITGALPSQPRPGVPARPNAPGQQPFSGADRQVLDQMSQASAHPEQVLAALMKAASAMTSAREANELLAHLETARQEGPEPPHPFYEELAALEAQVMKDCIATAARTDEALDFADTFWKHYGQQGLTELSYARAVEVAVSVQECLTIARKARLRYEEVGIKEPGQKKATSFRRQAPFGQVAQQAVSKARNLVQGAPENQKVDQEVRAIEREFQQLGLQSGNALY